MTAPAPPAAILFDFDGVLIESEAVSNAEIAEALTALGCPTTPADSMRDFMGLAGPDFLQAVDRRFGGPVPEAFHRRRREAAARVMADGIDEVAGAVAFVRALPADLPRAVTSSSSVAWIARHLEHLGLRALFGTHLYSGAEHVVRGKPAPDLYLHAADALGVRIAECIIIEDSVVGVTGAVASGARVIGLCAGSHCAADHGERLRALGAIPAADFAEVARLVFGNGAPR